MNTPLTRLARLQLELGAIAAQLTRVHFGHFSPAARWRPPINAYRCGRRFIICVDLAGADQRSIKVLAEPRRLILRGERPPPRPPGDEPEGVQVLDMEIDYGAFERVLELPEAIDPNQITAEHREGLLWLSLPMRDL